MVAAGGLAVVLTRDPLHQAIVVSFYGILLALMFFLFQAPDVALSQITIGALALPLMILLALAKIRRRAPSMNPMMRLVMFLIAAVIVRRDLHGRAPRYPSRTTPTPTSSTASPSPSARSPTR